MQQIPFHLDVLNDPQNPFSERITIDSQQVFSYLFRKNENSVGNSFEPSCFQSYILIMLSKSLKEKKTEIVFFFLSIDKADNIPFILW